MRIMPDGYFIIFIGMSILLHFTFPLLKIIPYPYSLIGIILIITGFLITLITNFILLKRRTSIKPFDAPSVLIVSGSFRFSRNPIYLGMTLILLGVATILGSLFPFILTIIFVIIINKLFIPIEENDLERLFGEKYLEYKTKVRRWI